MSRQNKVNPGQYHLAGRLPPDELARERMKQRETTRKTATVSSPPAPPSPPRAKAAGAGRRGNKG